jgi:hypothetical protein
MFLYKKTFEIKNFINHNNYIDEDDTIEIIQSKIKKVIIDTINYWKNSKKSKLLEDKIRESLETIGIGIYRDIRIDWTDGHCFILFPSTVGTQSITIYKNELNLIN